MFSEYKHIRGYTNNYAKHTQLFHSDEHCTYLIGRYAHNLYDCQNYMFVTLKQQQQNMQNRVYLFT